MTIDFSQKLKGINQKGELVDLVDGGVPVTLAQVSYSSLLTPDEKATDTEKFNRCKLAFKIAQASSTIDLTIEEAAMLKALIGKNPMPLVVGQAFEMLEVK